MQPRSEEFHAHAAECEGLAKRYGSLIKEQYEQLARQWLFLAEQAEAETFTRRTLVVRDPCSFAPHHVREARARQ
jgi:hypothetical protein